MLSDQKCTIELFFVQMTTIKYVLIQPLDTVRTNLTIITRITIGAIWTRRQNISYQEEQNSHLLENKPEMHMFFTCLFGKQIIQIIICLPRNYY